MSFSRASFSPRAWVTVALIGGACAPQSGVSIHGDGGELGDGSPGADAPSTNRFDGSLSEAGVDVGTLGDPETAPVPTPDARIVEGGDRGADAEASPPDSNIAVLDAASDAAVGLASKYPGDLHIENDPDVVFAEMGESATLEELLTRWSGHSTSKFVALDGTDRPPGSPGAQSIRLFTTSGPADAGTTVQTAALYKYFPVPYQEPLFVRWYVKYNSYGTFHHSGVRLGGFDSSGGSTSLPPMAGRRPTGYDFFYLGAETSQAKQAPATNSTFDFYNYWMHQRGTTFFPGQYFGNSFINNPAVNIDMTRWNCIEVKLVLNTPEQSFNGEAAMWINGIQVSEVKTGTLGTWREDDFTPDPAGTPFEGFQWRADAKLGINFLQLIHYVDRDPYVPASIVNSVNYDHIVVSRKYVGPLR